MAGKGSAKMEVGKIGEALNHAVGNIEKARIEVFSDGGQAAGWGTTPKPIVPAQGAAAGVPGGALLGSVGGTAANAVGDAASNAVADAAAAALDNAASAVPGVSAVNGAANAVSPTSRVFTVQFNPSTLRLSGHGGGLFQKTDYGTSKPKKTGGERELYFEAAKARIEMQVTLIFDKVNPKDAFMADKFAASPTGIGTGIAQAALKANGKLNYSVQTEIEAFTAMLRMSSTRYIAFHWGALCYKGLLNSVNTQYKMFSVSGQPIRGEVTLSLVLVDEEVNENSMGAWKAQYVKAFMGGDQSLKSKGQMVGNLLNL